MLKNQAFARAVSMSVAALFATVITHLYKRALLSIGFCIAFKTYLKGAPFYNA